MPKQQTIDPQYLTRIKKTCKKLTSSIDYISSGGCGIFAVCLAKILRRQGYDARIVALNCLDDVFADTEKTIESHNQALKYARMNNRSVDVTKSHYIVRVGSTYIDAYNVKKAHKSQKMRLHTSYKVRPFEVILGNVPIDHLSYLNSNPWAWNTRYNRQNNSKMEHILKQHLN